MADISGLYDENAEPSTGRELLPDGTYSLQLTESDIVATGNGSGNGLKFKAEVTQGDRKGSWVFGFINLSNSNETAQKIGQAEFAALRHATGVLSPQDTDELHYKEFQAVIGTQPARKDAKTGKEYGPSNTIKKYLIEGATEVPASKAAPTPAPSNDNPKPAARPWGNKKAA